MSDAVEATRDELCRGQKPNPVNVDPPEYETWPPQARAYVLGNVRQYRAQCPDE